MQDLEKINICETDLFHRTKLDHQLFLQILVTFLTNSIKDVVSKVVSCALSGALKVALSGALKVALLRAVTIQSAF